MKPFARPPVLALAGSRGFSLIELLIAMMLGLLVVAAAIAIFISNRQAYASTQSIGRIQESSQVGFELMARDIREASGNPCDISIPVANVVLGAAGTWWTNWTQTLLGIDDASTLGGVAGTNGIQLLSMGDEVVNVDSHAGTTFQVAANPFAVNDVLMVCDIRQLAVFRATARTATTLGHAAGGVNCSDSLNTAPAACAAGAPAYVYPRNSVIGRLQGVQWTVRDNGRGGTSLFRRINATVGNWEEVTEGVTDLQLTYLQPGVNAIDYVPAPSVTNWGDVRAVRIAMTLSGQPEANGPAVTRIVQHVVNLRNQTL